MIFITGAASTGKSSIVKALKERLPEDKFDVHDIDETDRWEADKYEEWRNAKVEHYLRESVVNRKEGVETILCGIIYPEQVKKSLSYEQAKPVKFIFIDASPEAITERFHKRWQSKIDCHIEIENELRSEIESLQNKTVVETSNIPSDSAADQVIEALNDPGR